MQDGRHADGLADLAEHVQLLRPVLVGAHGAGDPAARPKIGRQSRPVQRYGRANGFADPAGQRVTRRKASNQGRIGAYTPCAAFLLAPIAHKEHDR